MKDYSQDLCRQYPTQTNEIIKWYEIIRRQFPEYVLYWQKHTDELESTPIDGLQEKVFHLPYELPSGRTVYLKGKWDSVRLMGKGKSAKIYLMENKTKGQIEEGKIRRQLSFDLQTMMYLVSILESDIETVPPYPIGGVLYNVIRRPLSGGKGSIVQKKGSKNVRAESAQEYYDRLLKDYIRKEPETYFARWKVEITTEDITRFRRECLDPILEQLCDWYSWIKVSNNPSLIPYNGPFSPDNGTENSLDKSVPSYVHYRHPFGLYNVLDEGGSSELDEYLSTGSMIGLEQVTELFTELKE